MKKVVIFLRGKVKNHMKKSIYALYKDEKYLGDFTSSELEKMIGIKPATLYSCVSADYPFQRIYTFKRKSGSKEITSDELRREWDRVRKLLNPEAV